MILHYSCWTIVCIDATWNHGTCVLYSPLQDSVSSPYFTTGKVGQEANPRRKDKLLQNYRHPHSLEWHNSTIKKAFASMNSTFFICPHTTP